MYVAEFFANNKTELGLTPATKKIILDREKAQVLDPHNLFTKRDYAWTKKTR